MASQQSSRLKIPYPASTDQANISADMGGIATSAIDNAVIYHQSASGATPPAATIGDIWYCTDATNTGGYYGLNYYDGTNWQNIGPDVVSSTTTPSNPFPGMIWINPTTGAIQVYVSGSPSGSWQTILAYKIPSGASNGQFLQYSSSGSGGLVWANISAVPTGATANQLLAYDGTANVWRNAPSTITTSVSSAGKTIGTTSSNILSTGTTYLTGFTQYLWTVSFDTSAFYSGTGGTVPSSNAVVMVNFNATIPSGYTGTAISQRSYAGVVLANTAGGGQASGVISGAVRTTTYAFGVDAVVNAGSMVVKNGYLTVTGLA